MSQRQISQSGGGESTFLPPEYPASLFPTLESGEDERTSVISGRRLLGLLTKSGPLGALLRTLLVSPQWSKDGYSLKWDAIPLCSESVIDYSRKGECSQSSESVKILRTLDIPFSRCLFRLRLSKLPTEGTGSSLLPTPMSVEVHHRERTQRAIDQGQTSFRGRPDKGKDTHPSGLMDYLQFKGLLKTPSAMDAALERMTSKGESGTSGTLAQEMMSGYVEKRGFLLPTPTAGEAEKYRLKYTPGSQMGTSLSAMGASGMLPTPTARDEKNPSSPDGERIARKMEQGWTIELNDLAGMGMLPTPRSNNMTELNLANEKVADEKHGRLEGVLASRLQNSSPKTAGGTFRLSPLFTQEMMGFPFGWTELPFLSTSGEPNPSKPTETP